VVATAFAGYVTLTWDASEGATEYKIFRSTGTSFAGATEVTESPTSNTNRTINFGDAQLGERYYFWIVASNASGDSDESSMVYARPYVEISNGSSKTLTVPSASSTLANLTFGTNTSFPTLCYITANGGALEVMSDGSGYWTDLSGDPVDQGQSVSGTFTFANSSGSTVTFWDSEP
jgi:hypothetical protein